LDGFRYRLLVDLGAVEELLHGVKVGFALEHRAD
jgi:hypothetical protein